MICVVIASMQFALANVIKLLIKLIKIEQNLYVFFSLNQTKHVEVKALFARKPAVYIPPGCRAPEL